MRRYLQEAEAVYRCFGTLTVGRHWDDDPEAFRAVVDRWLTAAMRVLRAEHIRHGESAELASIFWWVEFQRRGAPHLHIFYTRWMPWAVLARRWQDLCQRFGLAGKEEVEMWKTSTRFERLKRGLRGAISYAAKYATKRSSKDPTCAHAPAHAPARTQGWRGRFWGVRGLRRRGSCHIVLVGRSRAAPYFRALETLLKGWHERGLVRRWSWEHGEGAVYFPVGGASWADLGLSAEIELLLAKMIIHL